MITRTFLILATASVAALSLAPAQDKPKTPITHVEANAAEKLIQEGKVLVLDVRTADEFSAGHIAGAKNADFTENDFEKRVSALDKSKPWLVHCASGHRSNLSLETLQSLGLSGIYHLDGGFNGWKAAGKAVQR